MYNIGMLGRKDHAPELWGEGQGLFLPFFFFFSIKFDPWISHPCVHNAF